MSNPPGFVSYKSSKTVMAETVGGVVVLFVFFSIIGERGEKNKKQRVVDTSSITACVGEGGRAQPVVV